MQEADEQDTCRICSAPAEPDQPLFHPCKCSGTIRYIHQDCLTTWLAHSKKKTCDVCKHPYSFTKVYASDMPSSLPPLLLIRRLLQQVFFALLFVLRGIAVAAIWLGVLPWVTVWTWRMYFSMGESAAWWISDRPKPPSTESTLFFNKIRYEAPAPPSKNVFSKISSHPAWLALSADIFTGQIIASLIVLTFVAVFLLREWISQNARPGVFEEEELPEEPAAAQQQQQPGLVRRLVPLNDVANANRERDRERAALNERQIEAMRALNAMRHNLDPEIAMDPDRWHTDAQIADAANRRLRKKKKNKARNSLGDETHNLRNAAGREEDGGPQFEIEALKRKTFHRHVARAQATRRKYPRPPTPELEVAELHNTFDFVIPLDPPATHNTDDASAPSASTSSAPPPSFFGPSTSSSSSSSSSSLPPLPTATRTGGAAAAAGDEPHSPFPSVTLQPPSGDIPFSLRRWEETNTTPPYPAQPPPQPQASASTSTSLARPPLPMAPLPQAGHNSPFLFSPGKTSLDSPSMSTYRAPEELQNEAQGQAWAGPSTAPGYFPLNAKGDTDEEEEDGEEEENDDEEDEDEGSPFASTSTPPKRRRYAGEYSGSEEEGYGGAQRRFKRRGDQHQEEEELEEEERERGRGKQPMPASDADMDASSESNSDVDMEAERNRYFQAAMEAEHEMPPGLLNLSESDDTEEEGEEDDRDDEQELELEERRRNRRPHPLRRRGVEAELEEEEEEHGDEMFHDVHDDDVGEGLFDDDDDDEAEWDDDEQRQQPQQAVAAPAAPPGVQVIQWGEPGVPGDAAVNADPNGAGLLEEDAEGNAEDDLEGVMEAIGMRGPIYGVFQNAALMIFVLDTAIGIGIWVPFTIGKTTALLTLDPRRLLQVLHLPIRAMRYVTDPFVDAVVFIIMRVMLPRIGRLFGRILSVFMFLASVTVGNLLGKSTSSGISEFSMKMYNQSADLLNKPLAQLSAWSSPSNVTAEAIPASNSTTDFLAALPDYLGFTEPYFEVVGREVRTVTTEAQESWIKLALGNGPGNRLFAVFLGYCVVCILVLLYLNILTVGNARSAGVAVRNAVRQQLLVLKVAAFIFIELVIFPLGCGIVLDLCTVWLFPEANLQSRIAFFYSAPLTAMFYHWVAGTMFMYSFAVLLSGCRSVMRPGAMWFIKDPQDQNSHPIRDILDRPTLTQLRKISISGLMYSFVVACVVGSVAALLVVGSKSILPFRWKNREPLSNVPVDLLFLHLVLPYTMHYFRPKKAIKHFTTVVWKFIATRLRLTSYFFGGRYPEEEFTPKNWKENFVRGNILVVMDDDHADGTFRRVPATDNLALPRDMRATVAVTPEGEPVDDANRELMDLQNAEAEKAKRSIKDDYMIVYMPPHFRWRIITFIAIFWIFGAIVLGFTVALPVQLGRSFFRLFTAREVHDGYSFIIGFYLVWVCYLTAKAVDRLDKRRQRRSAEGPRADLHVLVLKRGLLWVAKTAYMVFFLGIVIPVLLALVIDLYIILPIRLTIDPSMVPRIRIVDLWALGLLYSKIVMMSQRLPPSRISRGLQSIASHGWTRPDPIRATKDVIGPLGGGLLAMILFPGAVFRGLQYLLPEISVDNRFIFMHVYPTVFIFAGGMRSAIKLYAMLSSWSQAVRDKEFLVEMRLRNHEPEKVEAPPVPATGGAEGEREEDKDEDEGHEPEQALPEEQEKPQQEERDIHWDEYLAENERINAERRAAWL